MLPEELGATVVIAVLKLSFAFNRPNNTDRRMRVNRWRGQELLIFTGGTFLGPLLPQSISKEGFGYI